MAHYTVMTRGLGWDGGSVDVAYVPMSSHPDIPALVVELRCRQCAYTELSRIRDGSYPAPLKQYAGNMLLVDINYDNKVLVGVPGYKHHTCVIERVREDSFRRSERRRLSSILVVATSRTDCFVVPMLRIG